MLDFSNFQEIALRLGAAALCGLLIGLDREVKRKTVGLRTFLLVCLGAAGFSHLSIELANLFANTQNGIGSDPTRILQGIATGIGFLGGGAILQSDDKVTGVATGAGIWVCGAIGVACGFGFYIHAIVISAYAFVVLSIVGFFRAKLRDDIDEDKGSTPNTPRD